MRAIPRFPVELRPSHSNEQPITYYYRKLHDPTDDLEVLLADKQQKEALARLKRYETSMAMSKEMDVGIRINPLLIPGHRQTRAPSLKRTPKRADLT